MSSQEKAPVSQESTQDMAKLDNRLAKVEKNVLSHSGVVMTPGEVKDSSENPEDYRIETRQ